MVFEGHHDQFEWVRPVISTVFGLGVASAPGGLPDVQPTSQQFEPANLRPNKFRSFRPARLPVNRCCRKSTQNEGRCLGGETRRWVRLSNDAVFVEIYDDLESRYPPADPRRGQETSHDPLGRSLSSRCINLF